MFIGECVDIVIECNFMRITSLVVGISLVFQSLSWSEHNMAWLLGAFYFCYWMTELPGGLLAQKYGGRHVLGVGVMAAGWLSLAFPVACHINYWLAVVLRALQGLALVGQAYISLIVTFMMIILDGFINCNKLNQIL